jgi:tRNA(adenine34) deaminase
VNDEDWMKFALEAARRCDETQDVPVGAALVRDGKVLDIGWNLREGWKDPTAHAEIVALRGAATVLKTWHLEGCTLYVTLEPCAMCAGAIVLSRIDGVVFGAADPKAGFAGSLGNLVQDPRLNHRPELRGGVLAEECGEILREFFRKHRTADDERS